MAPPTFQIVADVLALFALLGLIICLIAIHFTSPLLTDSGPLSSSNVRYLSFGITALATLFTMGISGRIQHALLRNLETRLRGVEAEMLLDPQRKDIALLNKKWRGALRIGDLKDKMANYQIEIQFLICGLITTCIVSSFTPSTVIHIVPYSSQIPDTAYVGGSHRTCVGMVSNVSVESISTSISWQLDNGSGFYVSENDTGCPLTQVEFLATHVGPQAPDQYVYTDFGVGVKRTAMGTPASIINGTALAAVSNRFGVSLVSTTQCVPVMISTPFQCEKSGNVVVATDNTLILTAGDNLFNITSTYNRNFTKDSAMINGQWTYGAIGQEIVAIGGYTDPAGETPFAARIAQAINEPDRTAGLGRRSTYAVTCTVDSRSSFDYRTVTLDFQGLGKSNASTSDVAWFLSGGAPCTPVSPTLNNNHFGTAAASVATLLNEGFMVDGDLDTLVRLAGTNRGPPYAFDNSRNALEDIMGIVAAMAVSRLPMNGTVRADAVDDDKQQGGGGGSLGGAAYASIQATRLGSDDSSVLLFLIPPFLSFLILARALWRSFRDDLQPGGDKYAGMPRRDRPSMYAAENLEELLYLGRASYISQELEKERCHDHWIVAEGDHIRPHAPPATYGSAFGWSQPSAGEPTYSGYMAYSMDPMSTTYVSKDSSVFEERMLA